ncbi:MAG: hypothetical protein A3D24_00775 [Candidatus Blackburnbacteria bacterium RIFCSPHIGHO2_02_FULL_39_13]|uniref:Glycosyltransferase 2-like domain-containing protein n=1 Tax=Candidatus Blackburnbacteria bacterium RIFCSPLOWO2_01_FULL_40_20 TaxID=1797519 RepID=A0A1G1VEH1_9BACT|nr:MAG: Glycosyltransferase [Microgenomates group bacterium GW2011_GWA2_39_19]OGY06810.1 MAG: hypothetical protein A2694_00635 [Candidatus Blackburnbacteria bacterium RIFCSPHIGHO2_01_FULL_40_17]OGY09008.1 MAG: hypothetical protein A3D24_00775 [Candidatus Blackburnbacteria bacterium RIFCSPHIGHO2_02_FULL_39_13]OGY13676.1 MAG: hypothetical protein A3A77_01325 [Candidatus Blackburnbacteria bacterium RIFCSPLOWO2_01_FULL_40_20]OGY15094.1 MAG: hypothetical protein A3I52_03135 [Candidatus Blackburnbact
MKLVVVVPTYNEKGNVENLINSLEAVFLKISGWDKNILIVDDNSPDGTAKIVEQLSKEYKNVHLLLHRKKSGLGAAYLAGMKEAFGKLRADAVIVMDADLSHSPLYLPMFVDQINKGSDFVVGSRYIKGGAIPKNWGLHRKFLSYFGNKTTSFLVGKKNLNDWTSGYRAIKKEVYEKVVPQIEGNKRFRGYTFNISFAYHVCESGFTTSQVPIKFTDRTQGKSKLGLEYLFHTPIFLIHIRLNKLFKV